MGLPVQEQGAVRKPLPGAVHLRGDRPDPRLVLHADGRRHPGVRQVVVRERRLPGPHPRRGRPQDVQAPGQHPPADPSDGPARRGRGALVHGRRRFPVGGPPGRPRHHPGGRPQDPADVLEHRRLPGAVRPYVELGAERGRPGPGRAPADRPLAAVRTARAHRPGDAGPGGVRHPARRQAAVRIRGRPVQLVRPPLAPPLLAGRQGRAAHAARGAGDRHQTDGAAHPVHHRAGVAGPDRAGHPGRAGVGAPRVLARGGPRHHRPGAVAADGPGAPAGGAGPGHARGVGRQDPSAAVPRADRRERLRHPPPRTARADHRGAERLLAGVAVRGGRLPGGHHREGQLPRAGQAVRQAGAGGGQGHRRRGRRRAVAGAASGHGVGGGGRRDDHAGAGRGDHHRDPARGLVGGVRLRCDRGAGPGDHRGAAAGRARPGRDPAHPGGAQEQRPGRGRQDRPALDVHGPGGDRGARRARRTHRRGGPGDRLRAGRGRRRLRRGLHRRGPEPDLPAAEGVSAPRP
ncbi:hypothetical protein SGPA1_31256 [Streptomyces misionensis JCM 4497]